MSKTNNILAQPFEIKLWLETQMKNDLTNKEIFALFQNQFPWVQNITVNDITQYRKKYIPNYQDLILQRRGKKAQQLPEELENEILQEIREVEASEEEFSKSEQQKINMLKAQKVVLSEMYKNYVAIRTTPDETTKLKSLDSLSKQLSVIGELEQSEKSFLSSMDEVRKAELRMTMWQYVDSICGWFLLRMFDKAGTKEKALEAIKILHSFLEGYQKTLDSSKDVAEANIRILESLYVSKKVKEDK